jgi:hypothetical protein
MTTLDAEVLELLRDEPELLAIADAVGSTQRRRRELLRTTWPVATLVAVAAVALIALLAPWQGHGSPVVARALAALGDGPVVHLIVREAAPLQAGPVRPPINERQWELWYDRKHKLLHAVVRRNGRVVGEVLETPDVTITSGGVVRRHAKPKLDPALRDFATRYQADLVSHRLQVTSRAKLDGRPVIWLRSRRLSVAVDTATYKPVVARRLVHERVVGPVEQIAAAETLPLGKGNFVAPRRAITVPRSR